MAQVEFYSNSYPVHAAALGLEPPPPPPEDDPPPIVLSVDASSSKN
ncbi:MAG: hypothetical protein QNJ41_03205 [Xenococcaceae cyanobacterium MO_188.B32]|nr:hypothetical protein [Xenococcaceae cyanobacterium MO_188.B32]